MSIIFEHSEEACHKDVDFAMIVSQDNPVHIDYKEKDFIGDDYYTKPEIDILVKDFKTAEQIRNENELRRIQFEINREYDEDFRQANEVVRIENEDIRIENEKNRQSTFETLESQATELIDRGTIVINEAEDATDSANEAAEYAIQKANEAVSKWQLCGDEPDLPVELWFDCSDDAASLDIYAVEAIGKQAKIDGDYARVQGDYAKEQGDKVAELTQDVEGSVQVVAELIDISIETLTEANEAAEGARQSSVEALESANMAKQEAMRAANSAESALFSANVAMENSQSAQTAATAANTSAQAAESAASSAISAANQANTQAAFAQTQGQFSLQSGKFAEEAGAYAQQKAEEITGFVNQTTVPADETVLWYDESEEMDPIHEIGDILLLETENKDNVVSAVNEVNTIANRKADANKAKSFYNFSDCANNNGKFINLGYEVGQKTVESISNQFTYLKIPVSYGDQLLIAAVGSGVAQTWAILDDDFVILEKSNTVSSTMTSPFLLDVTFSGLLVVNSQLNSPGFFVMKLNIDINDDVLRVSSIKNEIQYKSNTYEFGTPKTFDIINGYIGTNHLIYGSSLFYTTRFDCVNASRVIFSTGGNSHANRCLFLVDGQFAEQKISLNKSNLIVNVPPRATMGLISHEASLLNSLFVDYGISEAGVGNVVRDTHLGDISINYNLAKLLERSIKSSYPSLIKTTESISYFKTKMQDFLNVQWFCFHGNSYNKTFISIKSDDVNLVLKNNGYNPVIIIDGQSSPLPHTISKTDGKGLYSLHIDKHGGTIILKKGSDLIFEIECPDLTRINGNIEIGVSNASYGQNHLFVHVFGGLQSESNISSFFPTINDVSITTDNDGYFIQYDTKKPRIFLEDGNKVLTPEFNEEVQFSSTNMYGTIGAAFTGLWQSGDSSPVYIKSKITISDGSLKINSGTGTLVSVLDKDGNDVKSQVLTPGEYQILGKSSPNTLSYNSNFQTRFSTDYVSLSVQSVDVIPFFHIGTIDHRSVSKNFVLSGVTGISTSNIILTKINSYAVGDPTAIVAGQIKCVNGDSFISSHSEFDNFSSSLVWKKITP